MNTALMQPAAISSLPLPGALWGVLQTERRDVCAALLADPLTVNSSIKERRQELQLRLRQIDNALDGLADNNYWVCRECGELIEQNGLASDPAISLCAACRTFK